MDERPPTYALLRGVWTALHLGLVAVAALLAARWLLDDGRGAHLVEDAWLWLTTVQQDVARAIPYPWGG